MDNGFPRSRYTCLKLNQPFDYFDQTTGNIEILFENSIISYTTPQVNMAEITLLDPQYHSSKNIKFKVFLGKYESEQYSFDDVDSNGMAARKSSSSLVRRELRSRKWFASLPSKSKCSTQTTDPKNNTSLFSMWIVYLILTHLVRLIWLRRRSLTKM